MSKEFNKYLNKLEHQEMLNDNIRGSLVNNPKIEIKKESGSYAGISTDAEQKLNNATPFLNPTENPSPLDLDYNNLSPNPNLETPSNTSEYEQSPQESYVGLDSEKALLVESLNIDANTLNDLNITAEELGVIVNLRAEVSAALGLSPENSDLDGDEDYSGISPEVYQKVTGRNLQEDVGIVDPANAQEVEVSKGIYNRDADLTSLRNEINTESTPDENLSPDEPVWRSKYKPENQE